MSIKMNNKKENIHQAYKNLRMPRTKLKTIKFNYIEFKKN